VMLSGWELATGKGYSVIVALVLSTPILSAASSVKNRADEVLVIPAGCELAVGMGYSLLTKGVTAGAGLGDPLVTGYVWPQPPSSNAAATAPAKTSVCFKAFSYG
jgi:hypothetical protein